MNAVCPHVGIQSVLFSISTFLGIFGVSVIYTTVGDSIDDMTSPRGSHLISWKNAIGLSAIVMGVMMPVGLRYYFKRDIEVVADVGGSGCNGRSRGCRRPQTWTWLAVLFMSGQGRGLTPHRISWPVALKIMRIIRTSLHGVR